MRLTCMLFLAATACGSDSTGGDKDASTGGDSGGGGADSGNVIDAPGADASTQGVACGMTSCGTGMDCCIEFDGSNPTYTCIASGDNCNGLAAACDGPEDCMANERCCGGGGGGVQCESQGGGQCRELCHTAGDCAMQGAMCCTSMFLGNYCAMMCF
jgi:hypothetical protein